MSGTRVVALLLAAGAGWESRALRLFADAGSVTVLRRCVDVDDLLAAASTGQADVAVVALEAPGLDARAVDHLGRQGLRVLGVLGSRHDADAAGLHAARIGLAETVAEADLDGLADRVSAAPSGPEPVGEPTVPWAEQSPAPLEADAPGRVVAVWGPQGAPGRTTVACGIAAALARRSRPTVVVDADPWGGAVAQQLGVLDEVSGMLAAARLATAGALGERFAGVQRAVRPGLNVVTGIPRPDRFVEVRSGTVEHLAEIARQRAHVVLDTGFSLEEDPGHEFGTRPGRNTMTLGALAVADEVVVVGSADPVGLSRLARALIDLRELLAGAPVRVVVNRNRSTLGWSERDIAGMVEGFARLRGLHFLPEDRAAVDRALVAGEPLDDDGPLARGLAEVALAVWPDEPEPARPGQRSRRGRSGPRSHRRGRGRIRRRSQAANSR